MKNIVYSKFITYKKNITLYRNNYNNIKFKKKSTVKPCPLLRMLFLC